MHLGNYTVHNGNMHKAFARRRGCSTGAMGPLKKVAFKQKLPGEDVVVFVDSLVSSTLLTAASIWSNVTDADWRNMQVSYTNQFRGAFNMQYRSETAERDLRAKFS